MDLHERLTLDVIMEAVQRQMMTLDNPGFCIACGDEVDGCEPDASEYECPECMTDTVYGAEELLIEVAG